MLYVRNEKNELEEIYRFSGKEVSEIRGSLECLKCENKVEEEKDILERVRKLGKVK